MPILSGAVACFQIIALKDITILLGLSRTEMILYSLITRWMFDKVPRKFDLFLSIRDKYICKVVLRTSSLLVAMSTH